MEVSSSAVLNEQDFYLPTTTTGIIVRHQYYTLSYAEVHEQAEWVAYELKKSDIIYSNHKRPYFIDDPKVNTGSASWKNYIRSGYDRGHLCPAGDRRFSKKAFDETFYTSNITPQRNDFNAGIWNRLEQKTRYWAKKYDGLYVVTGGVLSPKLKSIGKEDVSVPEYFYKVLIDKSSGKYKAIGFLVPHKESDNALYTYVVPIDTIEKMTGLDFFSKLPDAIENKLEKSSDYKGWSF
ncbi:MAG TPA: DNA/RNA non-specific endonuclease [Flavobacterium sp.]|nr:DNA/RNA non-specific endonuclease [Flavobacterium sp.]